jgi:hypothetical protein
MAPKRTPPNLLPDPLSYPLAFGQDNADLTSQFDQEAVDQPAALTENEDSFDQLSWPLGAIGGQWIIAAEDQFSEWSDFANSTGNGIQQNVPAGTPLPGIRDNEFQLPGYWSELEALSNSAEDLLSSQFLEHAFISPDNSSEPSQSALLPEMDGTRLDSSKFSSNTSSDNGSPIVTPTTSTDDRVPATPSSNAKKKTNAASRRKRTLDEMRGMTRTFPIWENQPPVRRTKTVYTPLRKEEVAVARQMGACVRCKSRKVSVSHSNEAVANVLD